MTPRVRSFLGSTLILLASGVLAWRLMALAYEHYGHATALQISLTITAVLLSALAADLVWAYLRRRKARAARRSAYTR